MSETTCPQLLKHHKRIDITLRARIRSKQNMHLRRPAPVAPVSQYESAHKTYHLPLFFKRISCICLDPTLSALTKKAWSYSSSAACKCLKYSIFLRIFGLMTTSSPSGAALARAGMVTQFSKTSLQRVLSVVSPSFWRALRGQIKAKPVVRINSR